MKLLFLTFFFSLSLLAEAAPATKEDIQMILKVMEANKADLENQIKATNQRIVDVNKRIEEQGASLGKRIEEQGASLGKRIDDVNGYMVALIAGIFATVGFIWWDRRTMIAQAKKEVEEHLEPELRQKADHKTLTELLDALREWSRNEQPGLGAIL